MANRGRPLQFLGAFLIVLGHLLPWECHKGFSWGCSQGLRWSDPNIAISLNDAVILAFMTIVVTLLLVRMGLPKASILWGFLLLFTLVCLVLYMPFGTLLSPTRFYDLLDPLVVLLSALLLWLTFWPLSRSTAQKKAGSLGSLVLGLVAVIRLSDLLIQQVFDTVVDLSVHIQLGLPLIMIGSLMIGLGLKGWGVSMKLTT